MRAHNLITLVVRYKCHILMAFVNRWFANRRRKQTKRVNKVVNSPACVTPLPVPASVAQEVISRVPSPVNKENLLTQITPDMISAFAHG
uniref:Homeobox domain-containing protein n=1 Tax=Heterorhabditis bacteriophora TaxID=37862 RepID=A0A1I7WL02_HETBA